MDRSGQADTLADSVPRLDRCRDTAMTGALSDLPAELAEQSAAQPTLLSNCAKVLSVELRDRPQRILLMLFRAGFYTTADVHMHSQRLRTRKNLRC